MKYVFIRTYEKGDYLTRLCYESWIRVCKDVHFIFYSEDYHTIWLRDLPNTSFIYRGYVANFGGQRGANEMINGFKKIEFNDDDYIISCDNDVFLFNNPIDEEYDFIGTGGKSPQYDYIHFSGQLMIFKGWIIKEIIKDHWKDFESTVNFMVNNNMDVCDDTYLSFRVSKINGVKYKNNNIGGCNWIHCKPEHFKGRQDWDEIIKELRQ